MSWQLQVAGAADVTTVDDSPVLAVVPSRSPVLAVVPARGGSTELKRKNLLPVDGTPMFLRSAQAARDAGCKVVVSTDDPEIRSTAIVAGFAVADRGPELADSVVDLVVKDACGEHAGPVLLVQPTVQPVTASLLTEMLAAVYDEPRSLVTDNVHQLWHDGGWVTERVNRQDITDPVWQELGIRWWPSVDSIGTDLKPWVPAALVDLVDVDTAADYRSITIPKRVTVWPIADREHGMGHLHRCLAIAERLQHHDVTFVSNDLSSDACRLVIDRGWQVAPVEAFNAASRLWILDRLSNDNTPHLPGTVISFEDTSQYQADLRIDALYQVVNNRSHVGGADWCVLRPEFTAGNYQIRDTVRKVLLLFGGTDPSRLGDRITDLFTLQQLDGIDVDWIRPGDNRGVAEAMHNADILVTSAGRTVFEAAAVGIPTIVLAQNLRETTHTHLGYGHGNIYLGLGKLVSDKTILDTVSNLCHNEDLRSELSGHGRPDGKGLDRIVHAIEGLLGGL